MEEGRKRLIDASRQILFLAENNPCQMSDTMLGVIAQSISSLIGTKVKQEMSREQVSRYLGVSTRTLGRMVAKGEIPKGHRHGHKELSWFVEDIERAKSQS